jgi:hypothetical protein
VLPSVEVFYLLNNASGNTDRKRRAEDVIARGFDVGLCRRGGPEGRGIPKIISR